jgi:hypothetical protein
MGNSKDLEPVEPRAGPDWYAGKAIVEHEPDWVVARPPYRADSDLERYWSIGVYPVRVVLRVVLWLTLTPYRFAVGVGFALLVYVLLHG